eukprot:6193768-Pleurochrysis_carterae.AAC.1
MPGSMLSVMPTSHRSDAFERSDCLKVLACAAAVLLLSMFRSTAVVCMLPSPSRRESSWTRYSICSNSAPSEMHSSSRGGPRTAACRPEACAPG